MSMALDKAIKFAGKQMGLELSLLLFILGFILKASGTASNKTVLSFQETVKRRQRQAGTALHSHSRGCHGPAQALGEHRDCLAQGEDGVTGPVWQRKEGMGNAVENHAEEDRRGTSWFVLNPFET